MTSIQMLNLCGDSGWKPIEVNFKNCITEVVFSNEWKKANVISFRKQIDQRILSTYRPVFVLIVCSKIFECLAPKTN